MCVWGGGRGGTVGGRGWELLAVISHLIMYVRMYSWCPAVAYALKYRPADGLLVICGLRRLFYSLFSCTDIQFKNKPVTSHILTTMQLSA